MKFYISTEGSDAWSGLMAQPNAGYTDGPFRSLERAKLAVREYKRNAAISAPVTVELRGGTYRIGKPIVFEPEDSAPVTYTSYPGETAALDGGRRIEGWREERLGSLTVWTVDVPEAADGSWYFRQLFVNGERRPRPRLPKRGYYWMEDVPGMTFEDELFQGGRTFQYAEGDLQGVHAWTQLADIEVIVPHFWTDEHMPIQSVDPEKRQITSTRRSVFVLKDDFVPRFPKYAVDNVFEALSEPGEWYLNRATGRLTYVPMPGETIGECEIVAPVACQLLQLRGNPLAGACVEGLKFVNLVFQHTDWEWVDRYEDYRWMDSAEAYAAGPQGAVHLPGVIEMTGARHCAIEGCTVRHIGWYGIELGDGCRNVQIVGNELYDLGAGGIKVRGADAEGEPASRNGCHRITDNLIHGGGRVFLSGIGIVLTHSYGNEVSHNRIHDLYYSGISCGWEWGYADSVSRDNRFEKNHIYDLGHGVLSDMGGIYLLGVQPGTVVTGNLIYGIEKSNYGGWAIYTDEGSSHIVIENNICSDTSSHGFHQHYGRENIVRNNIFAMNRDGQIALTRPEEHVSFTFMRNIVVTDGQPIFQMEAEKGKHLVSDANLYWDISGKTRIFNGDGPDRGGEAGMLEAWRKATGNDWSSLVENPGFEPFERYPLKLAPDSPAFRLGFRPIDMSDVGPRKERSNPDL
ncbi:right-handed parallel beta-helix repeat-containing protein [Cohnella hongkongensis]|uniref:Right-handed parallel beta-helix repeat-containing protein n=1 Tax=Cohnella hongkongensis TaxID=178337 RepID=A0ABV9FIC1_9BACL